jgi:hypothetical protein
MLENGASRNRRRGVAGEPASLTSTLVTRTRPYQPPEHRADLAVAAEDNFMRGACRQRAACLTRVPRGATPEPFAEASVGINPGRGEPVLPAAGRRERGNALR